MSSTTITLGIVGNPDSVSGIQPLVEIGNSPFNLRQDKLFIDQVLGDYYIELVHTHEYISYQYVSRPSTVHSFGAGRPGSFWMALTIPCKKRFANGVSPYDVLIEVRNVFRACFMTQKMDGSYEYKQGSYTSAPIDEVLKKYSLEDLPGRYIPMDGSSRAVVCPGSEKAMSEFFADTQYEQFARVSSVVVTESTSWSGVLPLEIPRPVRFEVRSGNKLIGELTKADETFRKVFLSKDDVHEPVQVSFSIADLRNGATYSEAIVHLNEATQIIEVQPVYPEKRFKVRLLISASRGELSSVSYNPESFFLITRTGQRKNFRTDETGKFVEFFGEEANLEWHVQYDVPQENCPFTYNVLSWDPKSLPGSIHVVLTPYAEFEGIEYFVSRHVHEQPVFLEVFLSNGDSYKFPLRGDGKRPFPTWRRSMIKDVRLVSDNYDYPALTQNYDPVSGWLKVSLDSEPAPRKKEVVKGSEGAKGYLEIVNQTVLMEAMVYMSFSDGVVIRKTVKLDRQSGDAPNVRIPIPAFTTGKLTEVTLHNIRNLEWTNERYENVIFKRGSEVPVEGPSKEGNYKVTVKELPIQSKMAILGGAFKKRIPLWALFTGIVLALVIGAGACYGVMEYLSQRNPTVTERPGSGPNAVLQQGKHTQAQSQNEPTPAPVADLQPASGSPDQQPETKDNNPSASDTPAAFVLPAVDNYKITDYYEMMKNLEDASGNPMTFDQAGEIDTWGKDLKERAGNYDLGEKFRFIEKYIPKYVEAAKEIKRMKDGHYRQTDWNLQKYYQNQVLYGINQSCTPKNCEKDMKALGTFRKAIQNLTVFEADLNSEKGVKIRRAIISQAPTDKNILANVNSFLGIAEALQ